MPLDADNTIYGPETLFFPWEKKKKKITNHHLIINLSKLEWQIET